MLPDAFASDPERLARFEREAKTLAALNHPNIAQISPDGKRIAWIQGPSRDAAVWLFDVERGIPRRLTGEGGYHSPVWSPDGTRVAAVTQGDDGSNVLAVIDVDRGGASQRLPLDIGGQSSAHWASTTTMFIQRTTAGAPGRLATLAMDGTSQPKPLFEWSSTMQYPAFSRDGKWMSYSVNETGAYEVYVRPVPSGTPVVRVSVSGGSSSAWSPDGRELFYREGSRMLAVLISTEAEFRQLGPPRELFSGDYIESQVPTRGFDITPDGRRFLVKARGPAIEFAPVTSVNVVLNWHEELKRLVPTQ